ncbi:MAG: hypothetical protein ACP6IP_07105 [Candidatus Njordarchaeia archaeon]
MIKGYIIALQSGILVASRFFEDMKNYDSTDLGMVTSGIVALCNFFNKISGDHLKSVIVGDLKLVIRDNEELLFAIISDRSDAIAEGLAKKYLKMVTECYRTECPNIGEIEDERSKKGLEKLLDIINKEIMEINEQAKQIRYIQK